LLGKGEKPLLPVNFCTVFCGIAVEEEEVVGTGQFAGRLVWQSGKGSTRRPSPDKLSFGQYFEGCARILNLLNLEGDTYIEYIDFLRQIGILLQTFTASSVFCLDHVHRQFIFESKGKSKWNIIENTLENSMLKRKDDVSRHNQANNNVKRSDVGGASRSKPRPGSGAHCYLFNLHKGCPYGGRCYYPHICSVDGCGMCHPAYKHSELVGNQRGKDAAKQNY
jgi:hypothetical protein